MSSIFDPFPTFATPRLELRALRMTDAPRMFQLRSDPHVQRYAGRDPETTIEPTVRRLSEVLTGISEGTSIRWGLVDKASGLLLGSTGYWRWDKDHRWAEVGYELDPDYWGRGLMVEAMRVLLPYAFGPPMNLHRVEARIDPANTASRRVLEKLGFVHEGTLRESWFHHEIVADTGVYGLLRRDLALV